MWAKVEIDLYDIEDYDLLLEVMDRCYRDGEFKSDLIKSLGLSEKEKKKEIIMLDISIGPNQLNLFEK